MREQKFEEVLCDVLHRSVGAWTEASISDEHCVALQAVCQVVVDALKIMCDVKVRQHNRACVLFALNTCLFRILTENDAVQPCWVRCDLVILVARLYRVLVQS